MTPQYINPLTVTRRNLPHWRRNGATYFITFRVLCRELTSAERDLLHQHMLAGNGRFYDLVASVIMPDHVHLLLQPTRGYDLAHIMKGIKGASARQINSARDARGPLWQDESWDRLMRDEAEHHEKLKYMLDNPVKRGLIADGWDWPWWYLSDAPAK